VFIICRSLTPRVITTLRTLEATTVPLQMCLRDVRADHVLFEGDDVRGIIDFGAIAVDHPAVDLARLLSDYESWEDCRVSAAMTGYQRVAGVATFSEDGVRRLAGSGVVCSMVGWLVRLLVKQESFADNELLVQRLSQLFRRAEAVARWL
jgi:homoserine kinase type II